ncbi:MAG TPA: MFS transporter [Candidatus Limnocylindrales bacterium]|nr:MFS transporter [Candidatus Limnocylindrales bacterium]
MRPLYAVLVGTFTLRFSTGLTGGLLLFYLARLHVDYGGQRVDETTLAVMTASFYAAELILATPFGLLSDRLGHHRVMQIGPLFGVVAAVLTWLSTNLVVIGGTRLLEGASTAASVPSILGFIAMVTAGDELLRGRASARFEGATLAGIGAGAVAAGVLFDGIPHVWHGLHRDAFLVNAVLYLVSLAIYRYGIGDPPGEREAVAAEHGGWRRYAGILTSSHVWLLAPTWIAINAALGLWTTQSLFQLIREPDPRFANQALMGGFVGSQIALGLGIALIVFFAGLAFWGERFKRYRRTTIIGYGIGGGALSVIGAAIVNHGTSVPVVALAAGLLAAFGLFVLAGATPAALGLLADMSEAYPSDRGAIMGLYSVFLAVGQIVGAFIGAQAAHSAGIDGILAATLVLLAIALVPLGRLRPFEHVVGTAAASPSRGPAG